MAVVFPLWSTAVDLERVKDVQFAYSKIPQLDNMQVVNNGTTRLYKSNPAFKPQFLKILEMFATMQSFKAKSTEVSPCPTERARRDPDEGLQLTRVGSICTVRRQAVRHAHPGSDHRSCRLTAHLS